MKCLDGLIKIAVVFAVAVSSTGNLPRVLKKVQLAQLHLLEESKASKWGQAFLLQAP